MIHILFDLVRGQVDVSFVIALIYIFGPGHLPLSVKNLLHGQLLQFQFLLESNSDFAKYVLYNFCCLYCLQDLQTLSK